MEPLATFVVTPVLPERLARLRDLAYNLRWAWDHATIELFRRLDGDLWEATGHNPVRWGALLGWLLVHRLGAVLDPEGAAGRTRSWLDEWLLGRVIARPLDDLGLDAGAVERALTLIRWLTTHQDWFAGLAAGSGEEAAAAAGPVGPAYRLLEALLGDGDVQRFLQVNRYQEVLWFNRESFDELRWWLLLAAVVEALAAAGRPATEVAAQIAARYAVLEQLREAEERSGYQVERLLEESRVPQGTP